MNRRWHRGSTRLDLTKAAETARNEAEIYEFRADPMPSTATIGFVPDLKANLLRKRMELGLTQQALAHLTGINQTTIARYESGARIPSLDRLSLLCKALGCSSSDLLGW